MKKKEIKDKKNKINKKIIIISIIVIVLLILSISSYFIFFYKEPVKSVEEVEKILNSNGYKTYYHFVSGENYYDNNSNCYEYDYSKTTDCKREITFTSNSISVDLHKNDEEIDLSGSFRINDDNSLSDFDITFTKRVQIDDTSSSYESNYYYYHISEDLEYLKFMNYSLNDNDTDCEITLKNNKGEEVKLPKCSSEIEKELKDLKNKSNNILKTLKINPNDLISYIKWYGEKYVIQKYNEEKEKLNTELPYSTIKKFIKNSNYDISMYKSSVVLQKGYSYKNIFVIIFENDEINSIGYSDSFYDGYKIYVYRKPFSSIEGVYGVDDENSCEYMLENDVLKDPYVMDGHYCTDNDKKQIKYLSNSYSTEIRSMNITENELISFAKQYYKENK